MIYLASPYSHPDAAVRQARYAQACRFAARLCRQGRLVYSPIAHSHPLAELGLPGDWGYWAEHNRHLLAACQEVVVLALPGWQESQGVAAELAYATELGLPVQVEECQGIA